MRVSREVLNDIFHELSSRAERGICILRRTADPSLPHPSKQKRLAGDPGRSGWQNLCISLSRRTVKWTDLRHR